MNFALIYPMFAMVALTMAVGGITFATRFRAVKSGRVDLKYFKTFTYGEPTEDVVKTQRHFVNLFEVPVLFYAGCLAGVVTGLNGLTPLVFAWLFVAARVAHAWIHVGRNKIRPRMLSFMVGCLTVSALWICVFIQVLSIKGV